ncbi:3-beta hydroxysteroid dehydrogenase/isomerase family protein-like protein [Lojkania enalia]|uniref:3-beta hydroxysteroid dehydrogenase/isomerase family protein-like protein n=1 Tax=Lojkania enalia TaxID=147567 RepID=A0A9P4K5M4_9PLEO|nr:3-beta hydroxysteroid dehydrogenase/isomerase family protein-like protein [Didymosphaeria enalia]
MASHRILLTGANGFVASHILSQLISASHSVRAVVRSPSKVSAIKSLFPSASPSQLDFAVVPDMTIPGAFDEALKSNPPFDIVMHTASPFLYKVASGNANDFLEPAIKGTTEVLEGIQNVAKGSVKRVVLTSSFAAVGGFGMYDDQNKVYVEEDWNPVTLEEAARTDDKAWKIVESGTGFDLVVLNPPMVYGPLAHKVKSMNDLNESTARIWNLFLKEWNPEGEMPGNGLPLYVDVRDLAKAHVLAMDAKDAGNQRFLVSPGSVTSQQIADIMREEVPGAAERVPKGTPGVDTLPVGAISIDTTKAKTILGLEYRSVKETFTDLGKQLLAIEKGEK